MAWRRPREAAGRFLLIPVMRGCLCVSVTIMQIIITNKGFSCKLCKCAASFLSAQYAMFLSLVFLAELVAGISGFVFRHEVSESLWHHFTAYVCNSVVLSTYVCATQIKGTFRRTYTDAVLNYNTQDEASRAVDYLQNKVSLCEKAENRGTLQHRRCRRRHRNNSSLMYPITVNQLTLTASHTSLSPIFKTLHTNIVAYQCKAQT